MRLCRTVWVVTDTSELRIYFFDLGLDKGQDRVRMLCPAHDDDCRRHVVVEIIAGIVDKLIIGGDVDSVGDAEFIVGFKNALLNRIARHRRGGNRGRRLRNVGLRVGYAVQHPADAELVLFPSPEIATDHDAGRDRMPNRAKNPTNDLLFEIDTAPTLMPRAHAACPALPIQRRRQGNWESKFDRRADAKYCRVGNTADGGVYGIDGAAARMKDV